MVSRLTVRVEHWPISGRFTISRGAKTTATIVMAEVRDGDAVGYGESVPYARYGESVDGVAATIEGMAAAIAEGLDRDGLQKKLPAGAARNALDCALWDLAAKRADIRAWELANLPAPQPVTTAYTISLDTPEAMAEAARAANYPLLKLKLGAPGDASRLREIRAARPDARLIVDANEGWQAANLAENFKACATTRVELIEQPLPAGNDAALLDIERPIPVCADESAHDRASLTALTGKYDAVNVKLDKTGGLTEALAMAAEAERRGLAVMAGCMVATSLAMAPAMLVAQRAHYVDLDGPLLLAKDRPHGLVYRDSMVEPPAPALWG